MVAKLPFLLGVFAKWQKRILASVSLSVRIELGFHWTDFHEI
jgi:hypothetical protein